MGKSLPVFSELHLPRPLDPADVLRLLELLATDRGAPNLVLELRSTKTGLTYVLGCAATAIDHIRRQLAHGLPGTVLTGLSEPRLAMQAAAYLAIRPGGLSLRTDSGGSDHACAALGALPQAPRRRGPDDSGPAWSPTRASLRPGSRRRPTSLAARPDPWRIPLGHTGGQGSATGASLGSWLRRDDPPRRHRLRHRSAPTVSGRDAFGLIHSPEPRCAYRPRR